MINIYKIFVISTLIAFSVGLRSASDPPPQYYSPTLYQQSLNNTQSRFELQIDKLNGQLDEVNSIISDANKTPGVKIVTLSQKMAEQRNSLYDIQQYLTIPFQLKSCECRQLSAEQKNSIKQKSADINSKISSLEDQVKKCESQNCQQNQYLAEQLKNMKVYMATVDGIINSDCCHQRYKFKEEKVAGIVDMSNYLYKDNLKATNWFYGGISEQDYKLKMFQLSTKYNVSNCPLDRPFANVKFNKCQKCDQEGAIFDLGTRTCFYCGKLSYLNTTTSNCVQCPTNQFYNFTKKACQLCSPDHFLNSSTEQCQWCPLGQHYNNQSNKCQPCPSNSEYDRVRRICQQCNNTAAQFFNAQINKCQSCPPKLFFNTTSSQCEPCSDNTYFDKNAGACVPCANSLVLNSKTLQCQPCPSGSHYYEKYKKCATCPPGYKFDSVSQICVNSKPPPIPTTCPSSAPVYNEQLQKCEACPPGHEYNPYEKRCLNHIGFCPKNTPFFNITLNKCVACPSGTTYNQDTYICEGRSQAHTRVSYV